MAEVRFRGDAVGYAKQVQSTLTGVWATADTARATVGEKTIEVTIGSAFTLSAVVAAMVAAINGDPLVGDESRNFTGNEEPEFQDLTASQNSDTIVITHDQDSVDFEISFSEVTAGSGAFGAIVVNQVNEGDNALVANNCAGLALPGVNDDLIFENSTTDLLYQLDALEAVTNLRKIRVRGTYEASIGLPRDNPSGFIEYLNAELKVLVDELIIGEGDAGVGPSRFRANLQGNTTKVKIYKSASSADANYHAIQLRGTDVNNTLEVEGSASVDLGADGEQCVFLSILAAGDSQVRTHRNCSLGTITADGSASVEVWSIASPITTLNIQGSGTLVLFGNNSITNVNILGEGTLDDRGEGAITNLNRGPNGNYTTENSSVDKGKRSIENAKFDAGPGRINDKAGRVNWINPIDFGAANPLTDFSDMDLGDGIDLQPS